MTYEEAIIDIRENIQPIVGGKSLDIAISAIEKLKLLEDSLELINRQKAEIERLKECPKCVYEYDGEVTEYCVQGPCPNFKTVEQIKTEAYKEFAEELKHILRNTPKLSIKKLNSNNVVFYDDVLFSIDNLLKEMTEVEINQRKEDEGKCQKY